MLFPTDRKYAKHLIDDYIRLKPSLSEKLSAERKSWPSTSVIGVHVRGLAFAQRHGDYLRDSTDVEEFFVPHFQKVESLLESDPNASVLICSDSQTAVDEGKRRFGARVLTYDASRSAFGEMHHERPESIGIEFNKYKFGEGVIIEACLLSNCDHFVHGRSSVANFVLCNAPNVPSHYVYSYIDQNY